MDPQGRGDWERLGLDSTAKSVPWQGSVRKQESDSFLKFLVIVIFQKIAPVIGPENWENTHFLRAFELSGLFRETVMHQLCQIKAAGVWDAFGCTESKRGFREGVRHPSVFQGGGIPGP